MYVILLNDDNTLIATQKERIMQRSKLVDTLCFLVNPVYNDLNMADYTVSMEYVSPISREWNQEFLTLSDETYNGYLKYIVPFDTNLTSEAGSVEVQLTFLNVAMDETGITTQHVRKTSTAKIDIIPISNWSLQIPDSSLSALDQRIIMMAGQIKATEEMMNVAIDNKADNIKFDDTDNSLQLLSGEKEIGDKIKLNVGDTALEDGVPIVNFGSQDESDSDNDNPTVNDESDVVEF